MFGAFMFRLCGKIAISDIEYEILLSFVYFVLTKKIVDWLWFGSNGDVYR